MINGQTRTGSMTALAATAQPGAIRLTWRHDRAPAAFRYAVALDGLLHDIFNPGTETATVGPVDTELTMSLTPPTSGRHTVAVVPLRLFEQPPDLRGRIYGNRLVATWDASPDPDAYYRVTVDGTHVTTLAALSYVSPELTPGNHTVAVVAVDPAGNESTQYQATVRVPALVPSVTDLLADVHAGNLRLRWTPPAGVDAIEIFSNTNVVFNRIENDVITTAPVATLAGNATQWTTPSVPGVHRWIVRCRIASRTSGDIKPVELDTTQAAVLPAPVGVEVAQAPQGAARIRWVFVPAGLTQPTSFRVEHSEDRETWAPAATVAAVSAIAWRAYTVETDPLAAGWIRVLAVTATLETSSDPVEFTPDSDRPDFPGSLVVLAS